MLRTIHLFLLGTLCLAGCSGASTKATSAGDTPRNGVHVDAPGVKVDVERKGNASNKGADVEVEVKRKGVSTKP